MNFKNLFAKYFYLTIAFCLRSAMLLSLCSIETISAFHFWRHPIMTAAHFLWFIVNGNYRISSVIRVTFFNKFNDFHSVIIAIIIHINLVAPAKAFTILDF